MYCYVLESFANRPFMIDNDSMRPDGPQTQRHFLESRPRLRLQTQVERYDAGNSEGCGIISTPWPLSVPRTSVGADRSSPRSLTYSRPFPFPPPPPPRPWA